VLHPQGGGVHTKEASGTSVNVGGCCAYDLGSLSCD